MSGKRHEPFGRGNFPSLEATMSFLTIRRRAFPVHSSQSNTTACKVFLILPRYGVTLSCFPYRPRGGHFEGLYKRLARARGQNSIDGVGGFIRYAERFDACEGLS